MELEIAEKLKSFFGQYTVLRYKKGEILIRADDEPAGIFWLEEGTVRQYAISSSGDEQTLNIYKPLSFFPMMWAINNSRNLYYFEATTPVKAWRAPKEEVVKFIKRQPEVLYDLVRRLYSGIAGLLVKMEHLMSGSAYSKLVSVLVITAKRFGTETKQGIEISSTEKELASQSGISRETVSRELQHLRKKGLVKHTGGMTVIPDLLQLEKEIFITES